MKHFVLPILLLVTALAFVGCATPAQPATPMPTAIPTLPAPTIESVPAPTDTSPAPNATPVPTRGVAIPSPTRPSLPNLTPMLPPPIGNEATPTPGGGPVTNDPTLLKFINDARIDLSVRANVLPDEIKIVSAQAVEWRNGALGCPKEGQMYTQAIVPGYLIVLDAAGQEWNYHAGRDTVFLCEK